MKNISSTIKAARREQKLTQKALGDRLGMSRNTIAGLENGTFTDLGIRKVEAILNALGYTLTVQRRSSRPTLDDLSQGNPYE